MRESQSKHGYATSVLRLAIVVGLAALAGVIYVTSDNPAVAGPAAQDAVDVVAIDADPTGNTSTALGPLDACVEVAPGATFNVDIIIDAIPDVANPAADGLAGFQFVVQYDSALLTLNSQNSSFILANNPGSTLIIGGAQPPVEVSAGPPRVVTFGDLDISLPPASPDSIEDNIKGIGSRLNFTAATGSGLAEVSLLPGTLAGNATVLIQKDNDTFTVGQFIGATIAVSTGTCEEAPPAPVHTPSTSPTTGGDPGGATPEATIISTPLPAATATAVAAATATAAQAAETPGPGTPTASPDEEQSSSNGDDGDGSVALYVIAGVVVGLAAAAGAAWVIRQRLHARKPPNSAE